MAQEYVELYKLRSGRSRDDVSSTILQSGEEPREYPPREYPGKRHWMKLLVDKKVKETIEKIRKYLEIYELTGIQSRFQMTTRVQHG